MDFKAIARKVRTLHITSLKLAESLSPGNYSSLFKGPGLEFHEVRDYIPGDDVRFIDWNVTSRMGNLFTKTYREERDLNLLVLMDFSSSMGVGSIGRQKKELMLTVFALLAFIAEKNNDRVGSLIFSDQPEMMMPPRKGKKYIFRQILKALTKTIELGRTSRLQTALRTGSQMMHKPGICFILSDFGTSNYKEELSFLARKNEVVAVRISSPKESRLESSLFPLRDPESGTFCWGAGYSRKFRDSRTRFEKNRHQRFLKIMKDCQIPYLEMSTGDKPELVLRNFFRKRTHP